MFKFIWLRETDFLTKMEFSFDHRYLQGEHRFKVFCIHHVDTVTNNL